MTAVQRAATSLTVDSDLGDLPSTLLAPEGRGRIAAAVIERSVPVPASGASLSLRPTPSRLLFTTGGSAL
jgi:hypothetical protein